jgi:hypothetical protein
MADRGLHTPTDISTVVLGERERESQREPERESEPERARESQRERERERYIEIYIYIYIYIYRERERERSKRREREGGGWGWGGVVGGGVSERGAREQRRERGRGAIEPAHSISCRKQKPRAKKSGFIVAGKCSYYQAPSSCKCRSLFGEGQLLAAGGMGSASFHV